jgi:putative DNA methylase
MWQNDDITPRPGDIFQERLYCIRWVEPIYNDDGELIDTRRHYSAPTAADMRREEKALSLLCERFSTWQEQGFIPSRRIEPGAKTDEPIRTRGWTHWHHLFAPRQLLLLGLFMQQLNAKYGSSTREAATIMLGLSRGEDYNSKLCRWHPRSIGDKSEQTFSNQALNTLYNYAARSTISIDDAVLMKLTAQQNVGSGTAQVGDARGISRENDIWITDPPYADAINYQELSEFFLSWYERQLPRIFPGWYADSKRALAVKGNDESFRQAMVACYSNLARNMPDDGFQVVMFTHQDAAVWADLTMILWAAGLRVTAAWCIATETESSLKQGNYVQGTVLLILRKRTDNEIAFLDEISHQVEVEVRQQLDSMLALEDDSEPNFADADYQLAAYAAALRVLTERPIDEIDPAKEIARERRRGEVGPVEKVIRNAVKIACDHLVPRGFDSELWKELGGMERFYLKGLEVESHGEYRNGVYQELARGFGAAEYTDLLAGTKANETRLKSASELKGAGRGDFGTTLTRQVLSAVFQAISGSDDGEEGPLDPAPAIVEAPVNRKGDGLWQHQKYFAKTVFDAHNGPLGKARYVLAD